MGTNRRLILIAYGTKLGVANATPLRKKESTSRIIVASGIRGILRLSSKTILMPANQIEKAFAARKSASRPVSIAQKRSTRLKLSWPILAGVLILLVGIAYGSVWHFGFIWDDESHLTQNACIVGPLGFRDIWITARAVYYPLVLTSFWIQHAIWGLNPSPYHVVNVAMHTMCALLLWRVLHQLKIKGAWLGAAIWALHPVQTESVAWITELKNTQSCFFYLLSILFFLEWRESENLGQRNWWKYGTSLVGAVAAMLSKSSTVMLPVVLALCWWWCEGRWRWFNAKKLIPFLAVSAAAAAWTVWEQKFHSHALGAEWAQTPLDRVIIAGCDIWFYLGKLFWPHPLIFIYRRWQIDATQLIAYVPIVAAIVALAALWWKRNGPLRPIFFAASYFVVSLFPVLGFFNVYFFRYSFVGDHFQYLASIGPLALVGGGLAVIIGLTGKWQRRVVQAAAGLLLLALALVSWRQSQIYRDVERLWRDTLEKNPDAWMAQNNLANLLIDEGRWTEAVPHLEVASRTAPNRWETQYNLGYASIMMGRIGDSLPYFRRSIQLEELHAESHHNLGKALLLLRNYDEADLQLRRALEINPAYIAAYTDLGTLLLQLGRPDESVTELQRALQINPNYRLAHYSLANTLSYLGRADEAVSHLKKAIALEPATAEGYRTAAWMLATAHDAQVRDGARAVQLAERANDLTHEQSPLVLGTLAAAYAEADRFPDAVRTAEKALDLASAKGPNTLVEPIQAQLESYQAGEPTRQPR
jgi:tetratricopeptide (TPR) repeat protein